MRFASQAWSFVLYVFHSSAADCDSALQPETSAFQWHNCSSKMTHVLRNGQPSTLQRTFARSCVSRLKSLPKTIVGFVLSRVCASIKTRPAVTVHTAYMKRFGWKIRRQNTVLIQGSSMDRVHLSCTRYGYARSLRRGIITISALCSNRKSKLD